MKDLKTHGQFGTDGVDFRLPSPDLLSGSSGNVGGSPDNQPVPGRWPSQRAALESHPEAKKTKQFVCLNHD